MAVTDTTAALDDWAARTGCRTVRLDAVGSTNTAVLKMARDGARGAVWLVAGEQTAGRGRHQRRWLSPPGNLYASRLVVLEPAPPRLTDLAFIAAVALYDAVAPLVDDARRAGLHLKWPNDLIAPGGKLAGILIEVEQVGAATAAAVGIGVNVAAPPDNIAAASLAALGAAADAEVLFARLGPSFEMRMAEWDGGRGFATIRAAWLKRAHALGTELAIRSAAGPLAGRFAGLAPDGALLLKPDNGPVRAITAGEVVMAGTDRETGA